MQHIIELIERAGVVFVGLFFILYIFKQDFRIRKLERKIERCESRQMPLQGKVGYE